MIFGNAASAAESQKAVEIPYENFIKDDYSDAVIGAMLSLMGVPPELLLLDGYFFGKNYTERLRRATSGMKIKQWVLDHGGISEDDATNVRQIIKAGSEQNVEEMEISIERTNATGISLGAITPDGVNADITIGTKGTTAYIIKVKYFDP